MWTTEITAQSQKDAEDITNMPTIIHTTVNKMDDKKTNMTREPNKPEH